MDDLKSLALRLLGSPYPTMPPKLHADLIVGALPTNLPFTLPIPEQARIVGSYVEASDEAHIVMDVDLAVDEILAFYHDKLPVDGWKEIPYIDGDGFQTVNTIAFLREHWFTISLNKITAALTDAHFFIHLGKAIPQFSSGFRSFTRASAPVLFPPEEAVHHYISGGARSDHWYSMAIVETSLDVTALENHYRSELLKVGWTLFEHYASEFIAMSTWEGAVLFVLSNATKPREKFAFLYNQPPS